MIWSWPVNYTKLWKTKMISLVVTDYPLGLDVTIVLPHFTKSGWLRSCEALGWNVRWCFTSPTAPSLVLWTQPFLSLTHTVTDNKFIFFYHSAQSLTAVSTVSSMFLWHCCPGKPFWAIVFRVGWCVIDLFLELGTFHTCFRWCQPPQWLDKVRHGT